MAYKQKNKELKIPAKYSWDRQLRVAYLDGRIDGINYSIKQLKKK